MKLYVIRHPETVNNVKKIIEHPLEGELTEKGKSQIKNAIGELSSLDVDLVFSSDSKRCEELAKAYQSISGKEIIIDKDIREVYSGSWIGMEKSEVKKLIAKKERPEDGESMEDLMERAEGILGKMIKLDKNILLITHGGLIKMIVGATKGMDVYEADGTVKINNCEIIKVDIDNFRRLDNNLLEVGQVSKK